MQTVHYNGEPIKIVVDEMEGFPDVELIFDGTDIDVVVQGNHVGSLDVGQELG